MKSALLVIDYITGIVNGSCKEYMQKHPVLQNTNTLIKHCRTQSIPIYFIRLGFDQQYSGIPKHSKMFNRIKNNKLYQIGNPDTEFVKELDFHSGDQILNKTAASPFHGTGLHQLLIDAQIERIIFSGISTDNAINIGTREANDMGYYTVIIQDACGGSTEDFHNWSLTMLDKIANEILTLDQYINA